MWRWLLGVPVVLAAWAACLGIMSALPVFSGMVSWSQSIRMTLTEWLPWMLVSPLILVLAVWFPLERAGWRWRVPIHLLACAATVFFCAWLADDVLRPYLQPLMRERGDAQFENRDGPPMFDHRPPGEEEGGPPMEAGRNRPLLDGPLRGEFSRNGPPIWMRASFNLSFFLSITSLCHAFVYFRRSQQRDRRALELETQLGSARLQALRMQLQPHFLFNTLNAISTLVQTDPAAARDMIANLGQMLRLSLDSGADPEVPLEQELKFLDCYLEIAQARFGGRLEVRHDIAPEASAALVPTFILQPLVENAIRHGIEPAAVPGIIEIRVHQAGEQLCISIRDTGVGLPEEAEASPAGQNGIGIANTKARLDSLYPGRHHFSVRNAVSGGCVAEMEIPFHTEPLAPDRLPKQ